MSWTQALPDNTLDLISTHLLELIRSSSYDWPRRAAHTAANLVQADRDFLPVARRLMLGVAKRLHVAASFDGYAAYEIVPKPYVARLRRESTLTSVRTYLGEWLTRTPLDPAMIEKILTLPRVAALLRLVPPDKDFLDYTGHIMGQLFSYLGTEGRFAKPEDIVAASLHPKVNYKYSGCVGLMEMLPHLTICALVDVGFFR